VLQTLLPELLAASSEGEVEARGIPEIALRRIVELVGETRHQIVDFNRPE
jgi:hypothetical protein